MARPRGYELSAPAFEDLVRISRTTLTLVAERAQIPRPTISSLLGGHSRASAPIVSKLAAALDVQPRTLFPDFCRPQDRTAA